MPECPVCQTEHIENVRFCYVCGWDLTPYPVTFEGQIPDAFSEKEKARLKWARESWKELRSQIEKFQQLDERLKQNHQDRLKFESEISSIWTQLQIKKEEQLKFQSEISSISKQSQLEKQEQLKFQSEISSSLIEIQKKSSSHIEKLQKLEEQLLPNHQERLELQSKTLHSLEQIQNNLSDTVKKVSEFETELKSKSDKFSNNNSKLNVVLAITLASMLSIFGLFNNFSKIQARFKKLEYSVNFLTNENDLLKLENITKKMEIMGINEDNYKKEIQIKNLEAKLESSRRQIQNKEKLIITKEEEIKSLEDRIWQLENSYY